MLSLLLTSVLFAIPLQEPPAASLQPSDWLVLDEVDARGRRPFREDAVFARYLLDPGQEPHEGESLTGSLGTASWRRVSEEGAVRMRGRGAYAYTAVEVAEDGAYLAELSRGATLFVNGEATAGDIYRYGFEGYPVQLRAGANQLFVTGVRGAFTLRLIPVAPGLQFAARDHMLPDVLRGAGAAGPLGVLLRNTSQEWLRPAAFTLSFPPEWEGATGHLAAAAPPRLAPGGLARLPFRLHLPQIPADAEELPVTIQEKASGAQLTVSLRVRDAEQLHRRTYRSSVDQSVQEYAVLPPTQPRQSAQEGASADGAPPLPERLALSLHGAGVGCLGQAGSYQAKPDFWIVAPTNRRKFGFDWQDWGRIDAQEVLREALDLSGVDPRRVYVTGHSMGGHGTWHLAANDPGTFAAAGPSAGWASFDTYGGRPEQDPRWLRADAASLTFELVDNLKQVPPFVIHGTADDNVPPGQALQMLEALTAANATVELHLEGGAGHWWGGRCVDWPAVFEHFRRHELAEMPDRVSFTTVDPGVDAEHHWVRVEQVIIGGQPAQVEASWEDGVLTVATENVRKLSFQRPAERLIINGREWPAMGLLQAGVGGAWSAFLLVDTEDRLVHPYEKSPAFGGPFKQAFGRSFVLVVGTQGDSARNAALLARARHDAAVWAYRGNGHAPILLDTQVAEAEFARSGLPTPYRRNLILYGNRDDNAAWELLGAEPPIDFADGVARLGEQTWEGDYAGVFVLPGAGRLIGAFASTSTRAARLGDTFAPFISGVGYPDYAIVGTDVLGRGDTAVRAAGWFDHAWRLPQEQPR